MAGFTAVDLSRLPAPDVVESLDFETIFAAMRVDLKRYFPDFDADLESEPIYKLLQVCAYRELILRQRINDAARAVMLAYAAGADLDNLGALLNVARLVLDPGDPEQGIPATMEDDEDYRRRIQLSPEEFSVAGPEGAYIFHALSAHADVKDASATSPTPGEVVVTVLSRRGDGVPDQTLLDAVGAALSSETVRPLTDEVTVQPPQITMYSIDAMIYTFAGPDAEVVMAEARRRIEAYIAESHHLGRDIVLSGIYGALHVPGVQRVELSSPVANIVCDRTQAAYCTALKIEYGGDDE